jgi:formylglycine-generating enzyme required for sulfatase activity
MMRLLFIVFVVAGVLAIGSVAWMALDLPPLPMVVSHGFPPAGGPTGRVKEIEGVRFVEIGAGYSRMGSWSQCDRGDLLGRLCARFKLPWGKQPKPSGDEVPVRWVRIARPYFLAETEITNLQYERFDPKHERSEYSKGDDDPVAEVSFDDAKAYCAWLSKRSEIPVRLPSEAEWENACRAGSFTEFCYGDDEKRLGEYAWFDANSGGRAHAVGTKRANAWGLYDLHGNVWEWCEDTYHKDYTGAPEDARAWTEGGEVWEWDPGASPLRVFRGGDWLWPAVYCRPALRSWFPPVFRRVSLGFRPALGH